jgi:UDP-N-acetylmuramate dehydrogenase
MTYQDSCVVAGSGVTIAELISESTRRGLSGFEHYINIPSSVGGALWQNLHFLSPDRSRTMFIEEILESAELLTEEGERRTVDTKYFEFGYDDSILHRRRDVVLTATFQLEPEEQDRILAVADANAAWRAEKHPPGAERMSAGSVFQKIEGVGAGRLIDQAGLKGYSVGGAQVSDRHANYILNLGGATAADVRGLIAHIQREVKAETGHDLRPEISFVGEFD